MRVAVGKGGESDIERCMEGEAARREQKMPRSCLRQIPKTDEFS
jgi:hypothetical protein